MDRMAPRTDLRCKGDADLREKLLAEPEIKRAVEKAREENEAGIRRRLLATSVRVTAEMSPLLHRITEDCRRTLGVETELEVYVFPSSTFNAACVKPESGRVFVLLASSLVEAFDEEELKFVIGHELGHHMFEHHELPIAELLNNSEIATHQNALLLFAWSRYAEISADRAALVCTGSIEPAARAFFKLASGLSGSKIAMRAEDLIAQLGDIKTELERQASADANARDDWFSTHPFSPLRLRAAKAFVESELFVSGGKSREDLEHEVNELMSLMEPQYLQEQSATAEAMRRLLFTGGVLIAAANGIDPKEIEMLDKLLGAGRVKKEMNLDALKVDLARRTKDVRESVPPLRRMQVLRDLCLIALADKRVEAEERSQLYEIAKQIEVNPTMVDRLLENPPYLD